MRVLREKRVLDLVVETRMQQGILGFVKRNYWLLLLIVFREKNINNLAYVVCSMKHPVELWYFTDTPIDIGSGNENISVW